MAPIALMPVAFSEGGSEEMRCAYVALVMAVYWVAEALPLPVTSLIPMVAFPFLGIMSTVGDVYIENICFILPPICSRYYSFLLIYFSQVRTMAMHVKL
jgi:di/tricarboxylate transporter